MAGWGAVLIAQMHARGDHRGCDTSAPCRREHFGDINEMIANEDPARIRVCFRSKTEARYAARLDALVLRKEIVRWSYEPITLTIGAELGGRGARYTPDFAVWEPGSSVLQLHEVKGAYVREAARVRFLAAAQQYHCFRWFWCVWKGGQWVIEEVDGAMGRPFGHTRTPGGCQ